MGRLIGSLASTGEAGRSGLRGEESVANESRADHQQETYPAVHQESDPRRSSSTPGTKLRITGRLTIDELLSEGNLAGLPEKYRRALNDAREQDESLKEMLDGEENMDIVDHEEDAQSNASDGPLLLYPTRGRRLLTEESMIQEVSLVLFLRLKRVLNMPSRF